MKELIFRVYKDKFGEDFDIVKILGPDKIADPDIIGNLQFALEFDYDKVEIVK